MGESKGKVATGIDAEAGGLELGELSDLVQGNLHPFSPWGHQVHVSTHLLESW